MAQRESKLSRRIMSALQTDWGTHLFVFKVWGNEMMMAGLPDILGCLDGMWFAIETKMPDKRGTVSPRQEYVHGLITAAGGRVAVAVTPVEACNLVRKWRADFAIETRKGKKKGGGNDDRPG